MVRAISTGASFHLGPSHPVATVQFFESGPVAEREPLEMQITCSQKSGWDQGGER